MGVMTTAEKIRLIVGRRGATMGEVAEGTGQTRQNFSNKLKRDDFKESELSQIAEFLNSWIRNPAKNSKIKYRKGNNMNLIDLRYIDDLKDLDLDMVDISKPAPEFEPNRQFYFMAKARSWVKKKSEELGRPMTFFTQTFGCPIV